MLAWCLVPVGAVTIDHDSWNVSGLQGTGSKTVKISDPVFVPKQRVLPISAIFSGKVPGLDVPGNDQARFGYPTFGPTALVAPIVGMVGNVPGFLQAFDHKASDPLVVFDQQYFHGSPRVTENMAQTVAGSCEPARCPWAAAAGCLRPSRALNRSRYR